MMTSSSLRATLIAMMGIFLLSAHAQIGTDAKALAETVTIADVHRHIQRWVTPSQLKQQMEEQNVGWSGAVGPPFGPWDTEPYFQLLGKKYIPTAGQMELISIYMQHGAGGLTDISLDTYKTLLQTSDQLLATGRIKGYGELILNNETSNPMVAFRRKVKIDAAPVDAMFKIAAKHKGFVQIHSEDDVDSVAQIKSMAAQYKDVSIVALPMRPRKAVGTAFWKYGRPLLDV
jgi:hypothetical protein